MLLKHTNDILKHSVVKPLDNTRSYYAKGNSFSCSFLNTYYLVMVTITNYRNATLNCYIYMAMKKILNSFSGKCNDYQEEKKKTTSVNI